MLRIEGDYHAYKTYTNPNDGRKWAKCLSKHEDGRSCCFSKRLDSLKKSISNGIVHECKYQDISTAHTLDNYFHHKESEKTIIDANIIYHQIAILIGKKNLSIEVGVSNELTKLIELSIIYGNSIRNKITTNNVSQFFHPMKRDKLRETIKQTSNAIHREKMAAFSKYPYVTITIDEGTTRRTKLLDFNIENCFYNALPYPGLTICMNNLKTNDYIQALSDGLNKISKYSIKIGSIIADGSKAKKTL